MSKFLIVSFVLLFLCATFVVWVGSSKIEKKAETPKIDYTSSLGRIQRDTIGKVIFAIENSSK